MAPELPDPSFAKLVVLTDGQGAREALKRRLREAVANGLAPEARVRVTQLVFGPYSPYPVAWRVMGPDPHALLDIAERVKSVLQASPLMRTVNTDWGSRVPVMHFSLNQDRLQASGLSSQSVAQQLQFLLSGIPITTVREDIRAVQVIGRAAGDIRLIRRKSPTSPWWAAAGSGFPCHRLATCRSGWRTRCFAVATARRPSPSAEMLRRTCSRRMSPPR